MTRHSILTALAIVAVILVPIPSYYAMDSSVDWVQGIGIALIPITLVCWIVATWYAMRAYNVHFWTIPSTYIAIVAQSLGALLVSFHLLLLVLAGPDHVNIANNTSLYWAAGFTVLVGMIWCLWYNIRVTSIPIGFSLTIMQMCIVLAILVFVWSLIGGSSDRRHERFEAQQGIEQ